MSATLELKQCPECRKWYKSLGIHFGKTGCGSNLLWNMKSLSRAKDAIPPENDRSKRPREVYQCIEGSFGEAPIENGGARCKKIKLSLVAPARDTDKEFQQANSHYNQASGHIEISDEANILFQVLPYVPKKIGEGLISKTMSKEWNGHASGEFHNWTEMQAFIESKWQYMGYKKTLILKFGDIEYSLFHMDPVVALKDLLMQQEATGIHLRYLDQSHCSKKKFGYLHLGQWMKQTETSIKEHEDREFVVLPLGFYSDKTESSIGNMTFYPFNLFLPSYSEKYANTSPSYRRLALIPLMSPDPLNGLGASSAIYKYLKKWIIYKSLNVVLEPLKKLSHSGIELQIYNMGQQLCYPIPAIVPGDLQEYAMLGGVNISFKCAVKDVNFLVNHEGLDSIDEQFEMRHEKDTSILISIAQKLQKAGDHQTALSLLKDWSVSSFFLGMPGAFKHVKDYLGSEEDPTVFDGSPYAGFAHTDCYRLFVPDMLHVVYKGIAEKIIDPRQKHSLLSVALRSSDSRVQTVFKKLSRSFTENMDNLPAGTSLQGVKLFDTYSMKTKPKVQGSQIADLMRLAPVAFLRLKETRPLIPVLLDYLEWELLCRHYLHTEETISEMTTARKKLQRSLKGFSQETQWKTLKFFSLRKFESAIAFTGSAHLTDTSPHERTHKDTKRVARFTNNHAEKWDQMSLKYSNNMIMMLSTRKVPEQRDSVGQKALRLGKPVFSTAKIKCQLLDLARDVGVLDEEMQATLRACPDLKQIKYSIRVQNIPLQLDDEIRIHPYIAIPHRKVPGHPTVGVKIYSKLWKKTNAHGSFIRVKGELNGQAQVWFAEVLCFLQYTIESTIEEQAFVHWLEEVENTEVTKAVKMTRISPKNHSRCFEGKVTTCKFTDLIPVKSIIGPAFLQKDPTTKKECYFYNKFVR